MPNGSSLSRHGPNQRRCRFPWDAGAGLPLPQPKTVLTAAAAEDVAAEEGAAEVHPHA